MESHVTSAVLSEEEHQDMLHRLILPAATSSAIRQDQPIVVVVGAGHRQEGGVR
ncbi:hypothetical protein [Streptomyces sp. NPDC057426]|uniref:hypothetical protein n=1 Tax=Streptomyces sp. NPDC057426 TaxID=3346128 RepID=UPI00368F10E0